MGEPLTLRTPLPDLTAATATAFFFLPKHCTTCDFSAMWLGIILIILLKTHKKEYQYTSIPKYRDNKGSSQDNSTSVYFFKGHTVVPQAVRQHKPTRQNSMMSSQELTQFAPYIVWSSEESQTTSDNCSVIKEELKMKAKVYGLVQIVERIDRIDQERDKLAKQLIEKYLEKFTLLNLKRAFNKVKIRPNPASELINILVDEIRLMNRSQRQLTHQYQKYLRLRMHIEAEILQCRNKISMIQ